MGRKIELSFLAVIAISLEFSNAVDYCKICSNNQQTLCKFPNPGPSSACAGFQGSGLTESEKQNILNLHNHLRHNVAIGNETRGSPGPQPAAQSMPNMQWDDELATVAQRWADQYIFGHDSCRNVEHFVVGQNVAIIGTTGNVTNIKVEYMVQVWYDEVKDFSKYQVAKFSARGANGHEMGHYTQLVWAKSTYLGCGAAKYEKDGYNIFYLVCNYGPAGNWIREPVYQAV
ncbi:antigen 5-like protein 1 precursor [Nasonia vitripennis]|uniref:SCP domain-containing protein n=1 Tax=Nasonia vitripennis TaxID=7425 RepID=A0A7M6UCZ5_NASVI|nr:antigen 5-like protein 1 precursor [Nasonia vitripennis]